MEKEKICFLVYPPPGAWKMQICKVLDSFSPKCSSARNVERCSRARGYPQKIFSDNLTNIDTNSKKMLEFHGVGPWPLKPQFFVIPVLAHFRMKYPKIFTEKSKYWTHEWHLIKKPKKIKFCITLGDILVRGNIWSEINISRVMTTFVTKMCYI